MDDQDFRTASDFSQEEDTWVAERRQRSPDPVTLFCCFVAVVERQLSGLMEMLQQHVEEGDRIREIAAKLDDANRQLEELVVTDALTGIGNRRMFEDRLSMKLAEASRGVPLTLLIIDVDNFKTFNDKFGHQAGDEALRDIAHALNSIVRKVDCLARYGGEEFALASTVTEAGALVLADKLLAAVRAIPNEHRQLTISVGITSYRDDDTMHSIVGRADLALYDAKRSGRDRAVMFEDIGREVVK